MKVIKIISLAALVSFLASCGNGQPTGESSGELTPTTENEQAARPVTDIYGTYQGVIPSANTAGIATHLTINSDETFVLTREYRDRKQGSFKEQGRFVFVNERVIELTDRKGIKTYYRINTGSIILSDPEGNVADADFASHYQLKKI